MNKDITQRNWRQLIASGDNATTPLQAAEWKCQRSPGYVSIQLRQTVNDTYGFKPTHIQSAWLDLVFLGPPTSHTSGSSVAEADSRAKTAFVKRANEQMQSFKGLQYMGEALESIRMLRINTENFGRHTERYLEHVKNDMLGLKRTRTVKRRRSRRIQRLGDVAAKAQSIVTQRYLEWMFGVRPLMADTVAAAETLSQIHNYEDRDDFRMVTAVGKALGGVTMTSSGFLRTPYLKATCNTCTKTETAIIYRGVVSKRLDSLSSVNKFLGLDPTDFLPTLWEIIPYSFVMDYVTNVSEIVDAVSFKRSSLKWVAKTVVQTTTRTQSDWKHDVDYPLTNYPALKFVREASSFTPPNTVWTYKTVSRDTYAGDLIPDFTVNVPNSRQALNVVALGLSMRKAQAFVNHFLTK